MAKNEAKIRFTAETGEFNESIKKSNDSMKELTAELKMNAEKMKTAGASVEGLEENHRILSAQLETAQSKTEALNQKLNKAAEIFGEGSAEVSKLRTQLLNAQTAEEKIKQAINKCNSELDEQKRAADGAEEETRQLDSALDDVGNTSDSVSGKFSNLALGVAAVGTAMVAAGKEAIEAFNEVDEGADNVVKATGATGEAAAELETAYKNVASSIVGDFGDIGSTLGEVNTRFGYTGSEAEVATEKFLKFSEITGVDSVDAVQSVSRALNDAGIPLNEYDTLLDQLAKAGQTAGIDVTKLADSLSENGSVMRSMGFDTQETIALLSQFELSGANTSVMLTGMKKAMATWADAGKDGNAEFANMVAGIKDGSVSAADAIDVFGTKAGPMLVEAIQSGKFEYESLLSTIQGSEGTLENTFDATIDGGYELELAMQNAKMAMAEAGEEIGTALTPVFQAFSENILPVATEAIAAMVEAVSDAVGWMQEHKGVMIAVGTAVGVVAGGIALYNAAMAIKEAMDVANVTTVGALVKAHIAQAAAAAAAMAPYILIVAAIAAVIAIIVLLIKNWDDVVAKVKEVWEKVKETLAQWGEWIDTNVIQPVVKFFTGLWNSIKETFANVGNWFKEKFTAAKEGAQNAWSKTKQFFSDRWSDIKGAFSNAGSWFKEKFQNAKENSVNAWSNAKTLFSGIKDKIVSAFSNIKEKITAPFEKARDVIKGIVDKIKGFFAKLDIKLPHIKLPHFSIEGEFSLSPPSIPHLSVEWYKEGGILTKPTIFGLNGGNFMAGGEAGAEAILPIEKLEGYIAGAIEKTMNIVNLAPLADAIEELANRPVVLNVNGRQFATATAGDGDSVNGLRSTFKNRGLVLD